MLVGLMTACGGGGGSPPASTPAPSTDGETPSDNQDAVDTPAGDDGITITWAIQTSQVQKFHDGDTYEDNRWSRKIKDELGINLEILFSADISTDAFRNRINVALASGDLPDIFYWGDDTWFRQAQEAGYLYDMTDLFEQQASDSVKAYKDDFPGGFEGATIDGRLYAFPSIVDNFHQAVYLWIRDDWLEASGKDAPKTVEEMVELARIFTSGDGTTYGLGLNQRFTQSNFGNIAGLVSAFGAAVNEHAVYYRGDDGKITHGWIQPGVKEALSVLRDMYAEGLIDPEFVVKDGGMLEPDVATGKIGMMYHMNWGTWYPFNQTFEAEGVITRPYPIPTAAGYDYKVGIESNSSSENLFMLNAKTEHPEAFMQILNLYQATVHESENPDDFQRFWADEQYRLCPVYVRIPAPELLTAELLPALAADDSSSLAAFTLPFFEWVKGFEAGTDTNPNAYGTWGQVSEHGTMAIALDYQKQGRLVQSVMAAERPDIWFQNWSIFETMIESVFTDIIIGARPLDDFDQFVEDWLASGGQQVLDELEVMYPN